MGPNIYKVAFNINSFPKMFAAFSDYMNFIDSHNFSKVPSYKVILDHSTQVN